MCKYCKFYRQVELRWDTPYVFLLESEMKMGNVSFAFVETGLQKNSETNEWTLRTEVRDSNDYDDNRVFNANEIKIHYCPVCGEKLD